MCRVEEEYGRHRLSSLPAGKALAATETCQHQSPLKILSSHLVQGVNLFFRFSGQSIPNR